MSTLEVGMVCATVIVVAMLTVLGILAWRFSGDGPEPEPEAYEDLGHRGDKLVTLPTGRRP